MEKGKGRERDPQRIDMEKKGENVEKDFLNHLKKAFHKYYTQGDLRKSRCLRDA